MIVRPLSPAIGISESKPMGPGERSVQEITARRRYQTINLAVEAIKVNEVPGR